MDEEAELNGTEAIPSLSLLKFRAGRYELITPFAPSTLEKGITERAELRRRTLWSKTAMLRDAARGKDTSG